MLRSHHYQFAQYILPEEIGLAPAAAWAALHDARRAPAVLAAWWQLAHAYAGAAGPPLPATGLAATPVSVGALPGVLLTLPPPAASGEAWLALVVLPAVGPPRCLLLEAAAAPALADLPLSAPVAGLVPTTLLTERPPDSGIRHVYGPGPAAFTARTAADFVAQVAALLA